MDIDPSEEGRTGGPRTGEEAKLRQAAMQHDARLVRTALRELGVHIGSRGASWRQVFAYRVPDLVGDRDVVAVDENNRKLIVAEVEGESSGQPEQKVYKAIGQIVMALKECKIDGFETQFIVVVPLALGRHLERASMLADLGIQGLVIEPDGTLDYVF